MAHNQGSNAVVPDLHRCSRGCSEEPFLFLEHMNYGVQPQKRLFASLVACSHPKMPALAFDARTMRSDLSALQRSSKSLVEIYIVRFTRHHMPKAAK